MFNQTSFVSGLSESDLEFIKSKATLQSYKKDELIFSQGDEADSFYIINTGRVSIFYEENNLQQEICISGPDDVFGEMGIFNQDKRSATVKAIEDAEILSVDKDQLIYFVKQQPDLAKKINQILSNRNEELILRENLIDTTGVKGKKLHISIKGDPSLRESAISRERYESVVDKILPALQKSLLDLLQNRCVYQIFIGFNSGEIRTCSVFDPFNEEIHTSDKLINQAYIDRHFPKISYQQKSALVADIYDLISGDNAFNGIPNYCRNVLNKTYRHWQPLSIEEIRGVICKLTALRTIPNFYLRNLSLGMIQDVIRMQFNCDATHIVSTEDYQRFLKDNLSE